MNLYRIDENRCINLDHIDLLVRNENEILFFSMGQHTEELASKKFSSVLEAKVALSKFYEAYGPE